MNICEKIFFLQKQAQSYQARRATAQLRYAYRLSEAKQNQFHELIAKAALALWEEYQKQGVITAEAAEACELTLSALEPEAKKYTLACVAHAHIDMNWMWGYNETVAITLDTFRTMLRLLKEYPQFKFSQSQASTYEIVEKYDPEMFQQIKEMVRSGRWEVTASTWVETDKNMPSGESLARHILYTKEYFREKFALAPDSLLLDFEPDTFGHNASVPEILSKGGVKYYFHCRGDERHFIYNWKSPSGATILVHREPEWYNTQVSYNYADFLPAFCQKTGSEKLLRVYGVGDHGGGPTRRDIERLMDMQSWPCYAKIEFTTYHRYFEYLEGVRDKFPTVEGELNYIFTGCYSSQSRIKQANRIAEDSLQTAEALTALAALAAGGKQYPGYRVAWQETLFNQFHDILPGSGVRQTRECALGKLEEILGYTYAGRTKALTALAARIDTSDIATEFDRESFADGAGMGYKGQCEHNSSLVPGFEPEICDRGCGKTRILNVFNPTAYARSQAYDFSLWDWPGDIERLRITDSDSQEIPFSVAGEPEKYWAHTCVRLTAFVTVPAYGYITLRITEGERRKAASPFPTGQHLTETFAPLQLENEKLRAQFDAKMQLASLLDKKTGRELISGPSGFFSLCRQNQKSKANAWVEGYSVKEDNLNEICPVFVTEANAAELRREVSYQLSYGKSTLKVTVALEKDSSVLQYKIAADWHELFSEELGIPALKFNLPFSYGVEGYTYGIPFGAIRRQALAHDVPAIGFGAAADPQSGRSLLLMTDSVYAYRGEGNALRLTLLRATQEPDLYPEVGLHDYRLGVGICEADEYYKFSDCFNYPLSCITNTAHGGELPQKDSLLAVSDNLAVSALKVTEDESGVIIRLFDATGQGGRGWIRLKADVAAETVDLLEQPCPGKLTVEDGRLAFDLRANEIISLKLRRKE